MIVEIIRKQRISKGLSQKKLAELSGVDLRTINRIENSKNISYLLNLEKIFKVLEININIAKDEPSQE